MQTTFIIHTISGRIFRVVADKVTLTEQEKTQRLIYEFTTAENYGNVNFILADEVAAIFENEIISFDDNNSQSNNESGL